MFHLRGFSPPWRFTLNKGSRAYCISQPVLGSTVFQFTFCIESQAARYVQCPSLTARTPYGVFPSSTAGPHHCGRYLLVVTIRFHTRSARRTTLLAAPHERARCTSQLPILTPKSLDVVLRCAATRVPPHRCLVNQTTPGEPPPALPNDGVFRSPGSALSPASWSLHFTSGFGHHITV